MSEVVNFSFFSLFNSLDSFSLRTRCKRPSSVLPVCSVLHLFLSYSFLSSRYFSLLLFIFYRSFFSHSFHIRERERGRKKTFSEKERKILSSYSNPRRQFNVKVMAVKQKAIYECDHKIFPSLFLPLFKLLCSLLIFYLYFFVFLLFIFSYF